MAEEIAHDPPPRRTRSWRWMAVVAVVIATVFGVVGAVVVTSDSSHHATPPVGANQQSPQSVPTSVARPQALRIPIPTGTLSGVALSAGDIWLGDWDRGTVSAYDGRTGRSRFVLPVGRPQEGPVSIGAGAGAIWALDIADSKIVRIDAASGRVTGRGSLTGLGEPEQVTYAAGAVWITANGARYHGDSREHLFKLDARTLHLVAQKALPGEGGAVVVPDPRGVWVACAGDPQLALFDGRSLDTVVTANIPVGQDLPQIVAAPSGIWVLTDEDLRRLDPRTGSATTIIATPAHASLPAQLAVDQTGTIWLADGSALQLFTPATGWRAVAGISDVRTVVSDRARIWVATGSELISLRDGG